MATTIAYNICMGKKFNAPHSVPRPCKCRFKHLKWLYNIIFNRDMARIVNFSNGRPDQALFQRKTISMHGIHPKPDQYMSYLKSGMDATL